MYKILKTFPRLKQGYAKKGQLRSDLTPEEIQAFANEIEEVKEKKAEKKEKVK